MSFDGVKLRRCTLADVPALALVGAATFLEAFAGRLESQAILAHCSRNHSAEAYTEYLEQPDSIAWLAEAHPGGAPVGYALVTAPDLPSDCVQDGDLELKRIYLFSRFHGGGNGQNLMQTAIDEARHRRSQRLLLGVHRENARALSFYRRNGFTSVGERKFRLGNSVYDDLVLALNI